MYSSRRKSKRSYRKRITSRKNKMRSKRKNLKFRKMRGGTVTIDQIKEILKKKNPELVSYVESVESQSGNTLDKQSVMKMFENVKNGEDENEIKKAIDLLIAKKFHNSGLSQQPKQHSVQQSQASTIHFPQASSNTDRTSTFFTPPITKKSNYPLIYADTINYPLDEKKQYIRFEQLVGRMGLAQNRVKTLTRVTFDVDKTKMYYVITDMESASLDALPQALYEKIQETNMVKRVGRYEGIMASKIDKLIFE